jgi:hypothetical protein
MSKVFTFFGKTLNPRIEHKIKLCRLVVQNVAEVQTCSFCAVALNKYTHLGAATGGTLGGNLSLLHYTRKNKMRYKNLRIVVGAGSVAWQALLSPDGHME